MDGLYFSVNLDNDRMLCLAPLTDRLLAVANQDVADPSGHFLYEKRSSGENAAIEIIAQVFSEDAVHMLRSKLGMD